jgi:Ser/Thr protein kinase RdoA (MazF antagonist)
MLSYLPGRPLGRAARTPRLMRALGGELARLGRALQGFFHPAAGRVLPWDVKQTLGLRAHLPDVGDRAHRQLAARELDELEERLLPELPKLRAQVIYNDANESNVLVDPSDCEQLVGFIDFGDIVHTALVNDLAVAIASNVFGGERPIAAAAEVVAGYHAVSPLAPEEIRQLFLLWKARLLACVVISAWRSKLHPDNVDYISAEEAWAWPLLERFSKVEAEDVSQQLMEACVSGAATSARVPGEG